MAVIIFVPVISCNYFVDPANVFHDDVVCKVAEYLSDGNIVEVPANMDEGLLQEKMIASMKVAPETVIIGSSHVMYIPFKYENVYNAGMSGSYLGDYYAILGLLKYYDKMPKRVVIGVDPWTFMKDDVDGRWTPLQKYAIYFKGELAGNGVLEDVWISKKKKLKELVSFSYFHTSWKKFKDDGLRKGAETVCVAEDNAIGEKQKKNPDGRLIPSQKGFQSKIQISKDVTDGIRAGKIYQVGTGFKEISYERLKSFEELIKYMKNNGIEVQLYLPAWHPKVYEFFLQNEDFVGVIKVEEEMRRLGRKYNIPVHGGYNPVLCNITEDDFMDWLHLKPEKMLENYEYVQ